MATPSIVDHLNALLEDQDKLDESQEKVREEFSRLEVTITGANGDTTFNFAKMPATKGWDTLEEIREAAGGNIDLGAGGPATAIPALIRTLPKPFTRQLRDSMFKHVTFRNRMAQSPLELAGNEETAFDAIEAQPIAIYEVFVRSLTVNFTDSFVDLFEKISNFLSPISRLPSTTTSQPSLPPQ